MLMTRSKLERRKMQEGMSSPLHARPSCAAFTRDTLLKADLCSFTHVTSGWPLLAHPLYCLCCKHVTTRCHDTHLYRAQHPIPKLSAAHCSYVSAYPACPSGDIESSVHGLAHDIAIQCILTGIVIHAVLKPTRTRRSVPNIRGLVGRRSGL